MTQGNTTVIYWAVILKVTFDSGTKLSTHSLVPGPLHIVQVIYPKIRATLMSQARIDVQKTQQ